MTLARDTLLANYRRTNWVLALIFLVLLASVVALFYEALQLPPQPLQAIEKVEKVNIVRSSGTLALIKTPTGWNMQSPRRGKASNGVVRALLHQLKNQCRLVNAIPAASPQFYATISIDGQYRYELGELNPALDKVYMRHGQQYYFCDKMLLAMALSPALNFIDKSLWQGDLLSITGDFGQIDAADVDSIDLSVLQIIAADKQKLPESGLSTLSFKSVQGQSDYRVFLHKDGEHLLLFDAQRSVIFVIATHPKLLAVVGL